MKMRLNFMSSIFTYNFEMPLWLMAVNVLIFPKFVSNMSSTFSNIPNCRVNYVPSIILSL